MHSDSTNSGAIELGQHRRLADLRLMQNVAAGDRDAKRSLADRLVHRTFRVAAAILRHPADAEDGAQQALVAIFEAAAGFRAESGVERWADRIAARTCIELARRRRRRWGHQSDSVAMESLAAPAYVNAVSDSIRGDVGEYLDRVSLAQREVLVLKYVLGYSIDEIATLLDTSPNTIKDRLLRGRQEVRRHILREQRGGFLRGVRS